MQIFLSVATFDEPHPHFVKSLLKYHSLKITWIKLLLPAHKGKLELKIDNNT